MKRLLSDEFKADLSSGGYLNPLLKRIQEDNTLMLAIREGYINVYYRGGNILRLDKKEKHTYDAFFDKEYASNSTFKIPDSPSSITSEMDILEWINSFPVRKQIMDCWFAKHPKAEREFQQLVVRENNYSSISNESEYFIADIEVTDPERGARYDLLAFKWPSKERKTDNVRLALIEMKYGDDALGGKTSGVIAHLKQFDKLLRDPDTCGELCDMAAGQINQLNDLDLILHTKSEGRKFTVNKDRVEVIFLFANHNPRSKKLLNELKSTEFSSLAAKMSEYCDIRFFVSSTAGYGMHRACMFKLDEYINFLNNMLSRK